MKFRAILELGGKTATGIEVPAEVVEALGSGKKPAVEVTINGFTYRSTVASRGGRYLLPVSAENRAGAEIEAGDAVEVDIKLDSEPREVALPPDFAAALEGEPDAQRFYEALPYSHKRQHVLAIEEAKKPETRQRRIDKAMEMLREGRKR